MCHMRAPIEAAIRSPSPVLPGFPSPSTFVP